MSAATIHAAQNGQPHWSKPADATTFTPHMTSAKAATRMTTRSMSEVIISDHMRPRKAGSGNVWRG